MKLLPKIILKEGREKSLLKGHPWVFSGAVERIEGELTPGDLGEIYSKDGRFMGLGHVNPNSQIIFRLLTYKKEEIGVDFYKERILNSAKIREIFLKDKTDAYRVVNSEGDFLPGLIIDRYGDFFVMQCLTAGIERIKGILIDIISEEFSPRSIYERSDVATRREEGLKEVSGLLSGEEVPDLIEIHEYGAIFKVDIKRGQKTGFYIDQRENRSHLRLVSKDKNVLDCFSYTGGFSIHAGLGGAKSLTLIDSSEYALELAKANIFINHLDEVNHNLIRGDVFNVLRELEPGYDLIILDPPPFVKRKGQLQGALRGYKDINLLAFRLLKEGGLLLTFSCSQHMSWDLFHKTICFSAIDAGKKVQILKQMGHPLDHPVNSFHSEGEYLKGFFLRVLP